MPPAERWSGSAPPTELLALLTLPVAEYAAVEAAVESAGCGGRAG